MDRPSPVAATHSPACLRRVSRLGLRAWTVAEAGELRLKRSGVAPGSKVSKIDEQTHRLIVFLRQPCRHEVLDFPPELRFATGERVEVLGADGSSIARTPGLFYGGFLGRNPRTLHAPCLRRIGAVRPPSETQFDPPIGPGDRVRSAR